jgi:hypothetical protein
MIKGISLRVSVKLSASLKNVIRTINEGRYAGHIACMGGHCITIFGKKT